MDLPADGHVHTEWSWDARKVGSMEDTCGKAVEIGLPAVAFTEHVDFTPFRAGFLDQEHGDLSATGSSPLRNSTSMATSRALNTAARSTRT